MSRGLKSLPLPLHSGDDWTCLHLAQLCFLDTLIIHTTFLSGTRSHSDYGWLSLPYLIESIPPSSTIRALYLHILLPDLGFRSKSYLRDLDWDFFDMAMARLKNVKKVMIIIHLFLKPPNGSKSESDAIRIIQDALPSINRRKILKIQFCTQKWNQMQNFSYWLLKNTCCW